MDEKATDAAFAVARLIVTAEGKHRGIGTIAFNATGCHDHGPTGLLALTGRRPSSSPGVLQN
jgi:hypothetical protein